MNLDDAYKHIATLEKEIQSPLPTPPIGTPVIWYRGADFNGVPCAALVTGIEAPGRVRLCVFAPNAFPVHKQGVLHRSSLQHSNRNNANSIDNGAWAYVEGTNVPKTHHAMYIEQKTKLLENVKKQIAEAEAIAKAESGSVSS
jgi:hypothetical protein